MKPVEYFTLNGVEYRRVYNASSNSASDTPVDDAVRATQEYKDAHPAAAKLLHKDDEGEDRSGGRSHHRGKAKE